MKGQRDSELARYKSKVHHTNSGIFLSQKGRFGTTWRAITSREAKVYEKKH